MIVLAVIYVVFALIFLLVTFREGQRRRLPWGWYRLAGLAMSLVWPAALLLALITSGSGDADTDGFDQRDEM